MAARFQELEKNVLALTAWRYASHYGSHTPQLMVAQVIANRYRKGWGSLLAIIDRMPKYDAAPPTTKGFPEAWDKSFLRSLSEIDPIYEGTARDSVNGALYFGDTTNVQNEFFLNQIARNPEHHMVCNLASLTFWD